MTSLCTTKAVRAYFFDNKLPDNGLICPTDEVLFPPKSEDGSIPSASLWMSEDEDSEDGIDTYSVEDLRLLENMRALGRELEDYVGSFKRPKTIV
ncbi:TAP-like domain-containing protein [Sanghuangporus baumii]|uniref:TAP-like domain-containing protein n=1 Tax=Sanghuangporus baumii TaxID=108892 RepID=A0A9Q5NAK5_SANBA|nr:TAP-like domain-containing protein [Sanghuangporus baumii]